MPYKFKDDGSHVIKPLQRKIIFITGSLMIARPFVTWYLFREVDFIDGLNVAMGIIFIWGVNLNGFYKLARWYMEKKIKDFDNKWR